MNIALRKLGDYIWNSTHLYKDLGITTEQIVPEDARSPCYFRVRNKPIFFLAVVKYGITFKELSDDDMERRKEEYIQECARRRSILGGIKY
jgi:hypothetical protein